MPTLLFPLALGSLFALVVPLAIHLARRSETIPINFAALRWLSAKPRPRTRLRFDELPLLAARLLLMALIALWLARPVVEGGQRSQEWVAVVPGVAGAVPDSAGERRWLAPGFPPIDAARPTGPIEVGSLLRQLDAELPAAASLRVIVPATLVGADAELPRLSRAVRWQVVPGTMPAVATPPPSIPRLSVRSAPGRADAVRYLRAAAAAWTASGKTPAIDLAGLSEPLPPPPTILVWLAPGALPTSVRGWVAKGGTALTEGQAESATVVWRDAVGSPLATDEVIGEGRIVRLTRALDPAAMPELLEPEFPSKLRALLAPRRAPPARVSASGYAPMTGGRAYPRPARDLQPWLAILVAAVFAVERWLATARGRVSA